MASENPAHFSNYKQWTQEEREEIIKVLAEKGVHGPCPRCGQGPFGVVDGYFNFVLQPNGQTVLLGGPSVPSILTACTNCGYLSFHGTGILGLSFKREG